MNDIGAKYGYVEGFLNKRCYYSAEDLKLDYSAEYSDGEPVPADFSVMTYNIWGLSVNAASKKLFNLRKGMIEEVIRKADADIICLQEMSTFSYESLIDTISAYKFASEVPYPVNRVERNRNTDVYILSKYRPSKVLLYGLAGVLGYENSVMIIEYPNLIVINFYNQSGCKSSPGQAEKWMHYSRCRSDILLTVYDIIRRDYDGCGKGIMLCGDFNCHLDGSLDEWPELEMINRVCDAGFKDAYRVCNGMDTDGFTEDTAINHMRWNQKLIEKACRYDAIFYRGAGLVKSCGIVGADEKEWLDAEDSEWFLKDISDIGDRDMGMLRGTRLDEDGRINLSINASDHFGILAQFQC